MIQSFTSKNHLPIPSATEKLDKGKENTAQETADQKTKLMTSDILLPLRFAKNKTQVKKYAYSIGKPSYGKSTVIETKYLSINHLKFESRTYEIGRRIYNGENVSVHQIHETKTKHDTDAKPKEKSRVLHCLVRTNLGEAREQVDRTQRFYKKCVDAALKEARPVGVAKPFLGVPNDSPKNNSEHGFRIMPFYQADLFSIIHNEAPELNIHLDQTTTLTIFYYLLCGVANIHAAGLVHGDIKPENIFLRWKNGLLEVGIADYSGSMLDMTEPMPTMSSEFLIMDEYALCIEMSNYQQRYELLRKMETYALGKTLYELLNAAAFSDPSVKEKIKEFILNRLCAEEANNRLDPADVLEAFTNLLL